MRRFFTVVFKVVKIVGLVFVSAAALIVMGFWADHARGTTLPKPTGPFDVGRLSYFWQDSRHFDTMALKPETRRQLVAWVWYPAVHGQTMAVADYLPQPWRTAMENQMGVVLSSFLMRDLSKVRSHSFANPDVSPKQGTYPLVLMRAGLSALTTDYTTIAEDIASHGYIVVGIDAPYRSFIVVLPDGSVVPRAPQNNADLLSGPPQEKLAIKLVQAWSADMSFALNELARLNTSSQPSKLNGRIDMSRVGVFGHSLGGATALQFCYDDARCKAGVDIDGAPIGPVVQKGVVQPFMFLLGDHKGEPEQEVRSVNEHIGSIYDRLPSDRRLEVVLRDSNHLAFSDNAVLSNLLRITNDLGIVKLDGARQLAVTGEWITKFFDVYLKGASPSVLDNSSQTHEIERVR